MVNARGEIFLPNSQAGFALSCCHVGVLVVVLDLSGVADPEGTVGPRVDLSPFVFVRSVTNGRGT